MTNIKQVAIGALLGAVGAVLGLNFWVVRPLQAKDRAVSDELVRIEGRVDLNQKATQEIINFINEVIKQAQQPK